MEEETLVFGGSLAVMALGLVVMVAGMFMSGLNPVSMAGIAIAFLGVLGLVTGAFRYD